MTKRAAIYSLVVIFFANFLSYLDRQIVGSLEVELKAGLGLTPAEFGWVGSAFTIGYMVFAPIVGYLIERHRRTRIFAVCVFIWSLATIGSGYAGNKWALYATRFFIGIGEAGCLVIGPTLLSDIFSKEVRGKALSIFFLALPLGGTAGYIVGGALTKSLGYPYAFLFAGLPGFLVAALIWALTDPPRSPEKASGASAAAPPPSTQGAPAPGPAPGSVAMPGTAGSTTPEPRPTATSDSLEPSGHGKVGGIRPYLALLKNRTLLFIILAQAFAVMFLQPLLLFGVGFFEKERGFSKIEATTTLGIIALVAGSAGNLLSGVIGDRLAKRWKGAYAVLAGVAFSAGLPFLLLGFMSPSRWIMLPALGVGAFCYFLCMPAVNTQIANSVTPRQRAMAYALAVFILHFLGDTGAPPAFGAVETAMGGKQPAFLIFSCSLLLAGASCFIAARTAAKDEAKAGDPPAAAPAAPHS